MGVNTRPAIPELFREKIRAPDPGIFVIKQYIIATIQFFKGVKTMDFNNFISCLEGLVIIKAK